MIAQDEDDGGGDILMNNDERDQPLTIASANNILNDKNDKKQYLELMLGCAISAVALWTEYSGGTPRQRPLSYQLLETGEYVLNPMFNQEFQEETVPDLMLIFCSVVLPLFLIFALLCVVIPQEDLKHTYYLTVCVWTNAIGSTVALTNFTKLYCGYFRPDFFDRCDYDDGNYDMDCPNDDAREDVRKSFPSGHSSLSFCGLLLLSMTLEYYFGISKIRRDLLDMKINNNNNNNNIDINNVNVGLRRGLTLVCYTPMLLALFISASRVVDNQHHPADVVGGAVLGGSIAYLVFGIWFPALPVMGI